MAKRSSGSEKPVSPEGLAPASTGPSSVHLAVGPFNSKGDPMRSVEFEGEKLSEQLSEGAGVVWGLGGRSSLRVERVLYHLRGEPQYAVHATLLSGRDLHPVLAKVELFPEWSGVVRTHPDLARLAPRGHRAGAHRPPPATTPEALLPATRAR